LGTAISLLVLSLVYPAVSQGPADLDVVPATLNFDWYYLAAYPILDFVPGGQLWLVLVGGSIFLSLLPWIPPKKSTPPAVVSLDNCNGCARCAEDCPFSAITMEPRSDGAAYDTEAVVNESHCMSCGLCVAACPTATPFRRATAIVAGIELPDQPMSELRERTVEASARFGGGPRVLVYTCNTANAAALSDMGAQVVAMPCVAMLPPAFIDFALSRDLADGVMLAGCAEGDCFYRLGDSWTKQRVAGERDPYLRKRVQRERLSLSWLPQGSARRRKQEFAEFTESLSKLPPPKRGSRNA